ncbi:hypothetical protein AGR1C_Lc80202 [Agrobacterium fabacearum TT111]|nr:hypothetical protein AGR1C_Lc80202 [Agrobacterium fabacearum TT111]
MGRAGSSFGRRGGGGAIVVAIRQGKEVAGTMSFAAPLIGLSDERVADSADPGEGSERYGYRLVIGITGRRYLT